MTTGDEQRLRAATRAEDAVAALLEHAPPRRAPPRADEIMIRQAVLAEWQTVTSRRRRHHRLARAAIAASVLLALGVAFNLMRTTGVAPVEVATISKSHGSIYVLGERATLQRLPDTAVASVIMAGQTIKTDRDSGIGLAWAGGGSLRIAADTVLEFISDSEVFLHSGRIYFDSTPSLVAASISGGSGAARLKIQTDHGSLTHLGTQYMAYTASDVLEVSVREGEVAVHGKYHDEKAQAGQQLNISGSARAVVLNIDSYGSAWSWVEDTSPAVNTDGRSVDEFLRWASRETGMRVEYPDAATEQAAKSAILKGNVNLKPSEALDFWLQGQDLDWNTAGGVIKVSAINGDSGQ